VLHSIRVSFHLDHAAHAEGVWAQQVAAYLRSGEHHHADSATAMVGNEEQGQPSIQVMDFLQF